MQCQPPEVSAPYQNLITRLSSRLAPECIITQPEQRLAYGTDASFYRLIPQVVLRLKDVDEVIFTLRICYELNIHLTFRAAGTSLSGQAVSDSVLVTLTDDWRNYQISEQGHKIKLQPGVIGADANRYLAPYQRKIGPDPASINACKIGGIAANNASGMCCGTAQNSYQTIADIHIIFADGSTLNTADSESIEAFKQRNPTLISGIQTLCEQTRQNHQLTDLIRHKYRLKNTTGYALNALIDYTDPIDVIKHLMIGSEGTLGFIAEITYHTVAEHPFKASALLVFPDIEQASQAVTTLKTTPVAAVEMMDGRSLRAIADEPGMPDFIATLDEHATALLIESHSHNEEQLTMQCEQIMQQLAAYAILESVPFTSDQQTVTTLWGIRKGLFPAVGAVRETGTTVIIEDVAFPIEHLAGGVRDLQTLFNKHHYHEAIIFGHALEGNLHFVFTQGFDQAEEIARYSAFMDDVAQLVAVKYGGSLKAEHGTGRNMAPYVELEWGKSGYALMQQIKKLFDPTGRLNPGVVLNADPQAHVQHLKPMPPANPLVDRCIECGFCEAVCPSRTLTLSPRQRIVLYRELQHRRTLEDSADIQALEQAFEYQGIDTCAATGLCATRCPVGINTGDLVKQLRTEKYSRYDSIARWTANHFTATTQLARTGLKLNASATRLLGTERMQHWNQRLRHHVPIPKWLPEIPTPNRDAIAKYRDTPANNKVVYFPSCASRAMGTTPQGEDQRSLTEVTRRLLNKAGFEIIIPDHLNEQCCGMPYDSKGMTPHAQHKAHQLELALLDASEQGRYPVLMDTSPCVQRLKTELSSTIPLYEPAEFVSRYLLELLTITPTEETIMLHITCSARKMGLEDVMLKLAQACAREVIVPEHIQCCGWAGDKGFTTPELNQAALQPLKSQIPPDCKRGFSHSLTCEIGLSHHSGIPYQSILYLVDEVSDKISA
ncbi:FAD-binding and (Fe-S)-binding domain-containing protein [Vibrio gazogenes]|uniref:D-lactate dehydrogenase (cytochrome) n=1 Tax=Vibrio gazogenes DSM 21264 = NBRC 103151 TaxID=1123492 RepID=A0A1M4SHN0_VIBGA|nr:FAD-binding and (Fe-S)-binding domain-containing protein [Vibrio gazogenes]USP15875.1 FAD-binding oxidoreductase [Vibrio gazogenes]SHE31774.1 D-lactate dehydrogenase [Vibrio gazogenes DSM 21264] [Vibrio gazogenes DSM 21264 = NBRC 103151]SJN57549.1 putative FAD-linked oxidoreductase [Vibrio gazogenes]